MMLHPTTTKLYRTKPCAAKTCSWLIGEKWLACGLRSFDATGEAGLWWTRHWGNVFISFPSAAVNC